MTSLSLRGGGPDCAVAYFVFNAYGVIMRNFMVDYKP